MSVKLPRRLSSKKKKPPKDNAQTEVLNKLGLEAFSTTPLDPPSMLDISTWTLKKQEPLEPKNLPYAFLQRLWLLSPDARSPVTTKCNVNNDNKSPEEMINGSGESQCAINPLDLVTAVFMSANTFLQQEMTVRMMQCQFAVPLVLPDRDPEKPSRFLLWPLRGVVSQWRSHFPDINSEVHEGNLASTYMPMVSCVKLGRCGVSKSQVLNNVINGLGSPSETFLHRGMDGGQLPRRLSNGLVEIGWYLPTGDNARDIFPVPVVISNLRGDAITHEKYLWFLCQTSSAVVVFCGDLREKEKQLLVSCKDMASKLILIDVSEMENNENRVVGFVDPTLEEDIGLPGGSVLQGGTLSAEELANRLCDILKDLLPDLKLVTLEAAAKLAEELGLNVDEGAVFKKAMATVDELLKGLDEGSAQFREKQLPLQGHLWSKLAEIEKEERKKKEINPQLQKEKKDILAELRSYKMTPAMKIFTNALSTTDKVERACFLSWMKLKLQLMQTEKPNSLQNLLTSLQTEKNDGMPNLSDELENGANDDLEDSDSFCTESTFEEEQTEEQTRENNDMLNGSNELQNGANDHLGDSDSFCSESTFEEEQTEEQTRESNDILDGSNELQNGANDHQGDSDSFCTESTFEEEQTEEQTRENNDMLNSSNELQNGANGHLGDSDSFCTESKFEEEQTEEQTRENNDMLDGSNELQNGANDHLGDSDSFCTVSKFEEEQTEEQTRENNDMLDGSNELQNGANDHLGDSDSFCSESTFEEEQTEEQTRENNDIHDGFNELKNGANDDSDFCTDLTFEGEQTEEQAVNTELQVSEQQFETGQKLEHIVQSTHEPVIEQQLYMTSNEREIQGEELIENNACFEESNSDPVFVGQNDHLKSGENGTLSSQHQDEPELTAEPDLTSSVQQTCQDVSFEQQVAPCSQPLEPSLGLEHFLREMSLIFELTHISPGSGSQNVLRLPSIATDLLLYGIPLELMDGDASNIPIHWLSCVFAKLKHRLPQEGSRTQVLTNLGVHNSRNAEVLSALFGVKFPEGRKRSTRGLYMAALCLPDELRKDMECDFLLLIDVEGLCSDNQRNTLIHDNEMATVATGLSDVLMHNISSHAGTEFETDFTVMANALLRVKECGSMPICQFLAQDEDISCLLQASQLKHVSDVLQTKTAKTTSCITCVKGPWNNMSLSEPVDLQYTKAVLKLKKNLFGALKDCAAKSGATGLPGIMSRLSAVWDAVRADSYSIDLQNTDIALAFSLFCTEHSVWDDRFLEHIESWLMGATKKISATKAKALDAAIQNNLLSELKDEARKEVKTEVDKLRSKVEASLMKDDYLKIKPCKPVLMSHMDDLQERVTEEIIQKLDTVNESHCSSSQLTNFEIILEKEQESKLQALIENSKSTKVLLQDTELEEEFDGMWSKILSNFDFRPSETDDITTRVINVLKKNLLSRGLRKHMKKVKAIRQNQPSTFCAYDEHFGYRSRLKHIEDNNRLQRLQAQQLACKTIEEYNQFVADKSSSHVDFSDSFITEQLENVEKALKEKSMEIRSAFEVDLKVYLCSAACKDFQKLHDRYAKDKELLTYITANKSIYLAEFIYQFRKRDQCQRAAQAFTCMVLKPTVLDYIYRPLGMSIVEEIRDKGQQYRSRRAFHHSLLEELIKEDSFESFLEYLHSYYNFSMRKIKETVENHLSETTNLDIWRQKRLGDIVGKIAAAVSETAEGTNGVLSDSKPLLERVCLTLERDGNVDVTRASLDGPLFSISTEWDRFITCLMELLAAMRLDLAQEFSQNVDITQLLQCLPIQPQDYLFNRLRGCDKHCPLCGAPCELEEMGHTVHKAVLHRPKGMWPNDSCSLPGISCPESMTEDDPDQSTDTHDMSVPCTHLHSLYPDWSISPEHPNSQMPSAYWRYVLARFNERFAEKYEREPAKIPDKWKMITVEEARDSLNEAFLSGQY